MPNTIVAHRGKQFTKMLAYGLASLALYFILYFFEDEILAFSSRGRWYFIVPVAAAFIFSLAHGNFTSQFWDMLGIKAKK